MQSREAFFATDLHGSRSRYEKLFRAITNERPAGVFLGGDLFAHGSAFGLGQEDDFLTMCLKQGFADVRSNLGEDYPKVFAILGNDDGRAHERAFVEAGEEGGLWNYVHGRCVAWGDHLVFGYAYVPPTPFQLKDWERYDVSRYVDPGCVSPEEGLRTVSVDLSAERFATMTDDLDRLAGDWPLAGSVWLFHSPPYQTELDRAALDGRMIDHVPLDVHVGSVAIRRFLEERSPLVSMHGHVHESTRITGHWRQILGSTHAFNAAHDGDELAIVRFDPENPENATRELL